MQGNNLVKIQEMLLLEMERLNDNEYMKNNGKDEIARSNALSGNAESYLKAVLTNIRIMEISERSRNTYDNVTKQLGLGAINEKN